MNPIEMRKTPDGYFTSRWGLACRGDPADRTADRHLHAGALHALFSRISTAQSGWRAGFLALAGLAAVGVIPALLGLPGKAKVSEVPLSDGYPAVRRSPLFRLQFIAFCAMAFAFAGLLPHFVPMLLETGIAIEQARGASVIVTRVIVGWDLHC